MTRPATITALLGCLSATACSSSYSRPQAVLPPLPARPTFDLKHLEASSNSATRELSSEMYAMASGPQGGSPAGAGRRISQAVDRALDSITGRGEGGSGGAALPSLSAGDRQDRIELEAQLSLEVRDAASGAEAVRRLVAQHGGSVSKDERHAPPSGTAPWSRAQADLLVRVPSDRFEAFAAALAKVGDTRARSVKAVDASMEERDLAVVLQNLEAARARYRELLQKATEPADVLATEREIERTSSDVDRVTARLDWLRDRIARATVAIQLRAPEPDADDERKPYFAPGGRGILHVDVGAGETEVFAGAGISFRFPQTPALPWRGLVLDVDLLRVCCGSTPERGALAFDVLGGIDIHSASLGGGKRRWMNPYLGVRMGYAETRSRGDLAAGGVVGLELAKTQVFTLDLQTRFTALVGNAEGPHGAVQPSLGAGLGF